MEKLRIRLAGDHEVARQGVRILVEKDPGWESCGEAPDSGTAVALAEKLLPDLAVLDMGIAAWNGPTLPQ